MTAGETMAISTLNYPNNYTNNEKCTYGFICTTKNVKTLTMNFTTFDVEASNNCTNDVVKVFDGTRLDSPILARMCGKRANLNPKPVFKSSSPKFMVQFNTNDKITGTGFEVAVSCPCKIACLL